MQEFQTLKLERSGPIDILSLNRPKNLNAITGTMVRELYKYFVDLESTPSCRVVLLKGEGSAFCAGLDIKQRRSGGDTVGGVAPLGREASLSMVVRLMRRCPQPIISLIHGPACGGGFAFALASDVRIAGTSARMNDAFIRIGVSGGELGLSHFLPRLVGLSVASELMLTGNFIGAERALSVGLVSDVVADDELKAAGLRMAQDMLRASPIGLRKTKEVINASQRLNDLDLTIDLEERNQMLCIETGVYAEAMDAFLEKRDPDYAGYPLEREFGGTSNANNI